LKGDVGCKRQNTKEKNSPFEGGWGDVKNKN
jgi:hypothetical protein